MLSARAPALGCSCNGSLVKGEEKPPRLENTNVKFSGNSLYLSARLILFCDGKSENLAPL